MANQEHLDLLLKNPTGFKIKKADLRGANLRYADLSGAKLSEANLSNADLSGANLYETHLYKADLSGADLYEANLSGANLSVANLYEADLRWADLSNADLRWANLNGADLSGANLSGARYNFYTIGIHPAPEGELKGYKNVKGRIVKLLIPKEAKRSCATTRKHRAEYAKVLEISDGLLEITNNSYVPNITYKVGELVYPDSFDEDRWVECSHGIHFFLTKEEAENW